MCYAGRFALSEQSKVDVDSSFLGVNKANSGVHGLLSNNQPSLPGIGRCR